jgi:putative FmdB family regulatory protein
LPTYEYHCDHCEKNFDVVQSFHDDPLTACPTCGKAVRKVFGNVGIVFRGSGFYKTDSRSASPVKPSDGKEPDGKESSPATDPGSKTAASTKEGPSSTPLDTSTSTPSGPTTAPDVESRTKTSEAGSTPTN